jgi:glycoside/pentoside/hexuronide:cation symporter, GPH family
VPDTTCVSAAPAKSWSEEADRRVAQDANGISTIRELAYAAPVAGSWFFYIPMWSILPGFYAKYGGLSLTSIATVILSIRLFDGVADMTIGYLSDWHRSSGGSRKVWVVIGGAGTVVASFFLLTPPQPSTTAYYLIWSIAFFLAFTIVEIPHMTWGSELTMGYQQRTRIYGVRNVVTRVGVVAFYALPLLPIYRAHEYTPQVLRDAIYVGSLMTVLGLALTIVAAPAGIPVTLSIRDNPRLFIRSLVRNKPLVLYCMTFGCLGLSSGMWFGLVYFYLDSYLKLGGKIAIIFLVGYLIGALSTPLWVKLIHRTSKSTAWATGVSLFLLQSGAVFFVRPDTSWWVPFGLIGIVNLYFTGHDVAALSLLGDIVDYGKLKFHKDRGATYFALNILIFKFGLGIGGGLAFAIVGWFGFDPSVAVHSGRAMLGFKLAFTVLPACLSLMALILIVLSPIDRRRHRIIQRRIESRILRSDKQTARRLTITTPPINGREHVVNQSATA